MFKKVKSRYMSDNVLRDISIIVFWGSMWGIVEATLGWFLHTINFRSGGCIWFPLAFYFMNKIYKKTGKSQYMLYGAFITAGIKLTNLFIEVRVNKVVNPSVSIILEAIALVVLYKILEKSKQKAGIVGIGAVNILWRSLYAAYLLVIPMSALRGINTILSFIVLESITSTIIIMAYIACSERFSKKALVKNINSFTIIKPISSLLIFALAIVVQLTI